MLGWLCYVMIARLALDLNAMHLGVVMGFDYLVC